jgi:distribution and morphology protein 31
MWRNVSVKREGLRKAPSLLLALAGKDQNAQQSLWRIPNTALRGYQTQYTNRPLVNSPLIRQDFRNRQKDVRSILSEVKNGLARYKSSIASRRADALRRSKSSMSNSKKPNETAPAPKAELSPNPSSGIKTSILSGSVTKPILDRLPHLPHIHRPTKDELLSAANGFWSRLKVRIKWFSIKSDRPFNIDDISGFLSWIFVGHLVWVIVGTTTFFSLAILLVNTVFAQETLAKWVGEYLTKSSGIHIVFESAIVPKWGDGVISFSNVFVSRRPGKGKAKVIKGSQAQLAAAAASNQATNKSSNDEDDGNYTQFDVSIETVNVTLSFAKWFNGKGILRDVEMKGIRGVIDRTFVKETGIYIDPKSWRREHNPGDFEIESFKLEDLLVTVYQPNNFRPFNISIFSCDLPKLRQQWLFYDFMSANNVSGSIDNSLFTLHPRQTHNHTALRPGEVDENGNTTPWKKRSRLRIDGLNIDHLNRGLDGPFSWIREGNVDVVADIMFPADDDESVAKVISDVIDRVEATVTTNSIPAVKSSTDFEPKALPSTEGFSNTESSTVQPQLHSMEEADRFLVMDLRIHLNDVRAGVPIFTKDISYVNNALIRPIVAYINSRRAFIPVNCRVVKRKSEFDGSWTLFDSGMLEDMNREVRLPLFNIT